MRPRLRIFAETDAREADSSTPSMTVQLGDFLTVIRGAASADRVWLDDFADEDIQVSHDLFEILAAYRRIQDAAPDETQDRCA